MAHTDDTATMEAHELIWKTLRDLGVDFIPLNWVRCPACEDGLPWTPGNAHFGIPLVCYPCGLLALEAVTGDEWYRKAHNAALKTTTRARWTYF